MTQYGWISLIAMTAWLVLALSSYRAHRVGAGKTTVMALAWLAIFLLVTGVIAAAGA
jgi:hypothetical protein